MSKAPGVRKTIIVGAIALAVLVAGMLYVIEDANDVDVSRSVTDTRTHTDGAVRHDDERSRAEPQGDAPAQPQRTGSEDVPADPRLAALTVSPPSDLIEFIVGADGKVIKEIDQDPSSLGFKRPSREYTYANGRVVALTAYRYFGDHVEITKIAVSYKPDGSVDQYMESVSTDHGTQSARVP